MKLLQGTKAWIAVCESREKEFQVKIFSTLAGFTNMKLITCLQLPGRNVKQ